MAGPSKSDIFAMYVSMRQSGQNPDDVVKSLTDAAYQLSRDDRHALGRAVQDWEATNGANYPESEAQEVAESEPSAPSLPRVTAPSQLPAALGSSVQSNVGPSAFGTRMLSPEALASIAAPTMT